jgi:hypothetical protein
MNYKIEYGRYGVKDWESDLVLPFEDDFETAKAMIIAVSGVYKADKEYAISDNIVNVRMIEDSDEKKPPRVIHYITPFYPNVSLPSTR